jgi:transcription elongation factor GreB
MPDTPNYITPTGLARLRAEYDHLRKVARPTVVQEVADAAAMGDRSENAEYIYGKKRLREIDRRLRFLQQRIDAAVVVDPAGQRNPDRVFFGATVVLEDEQGQAKTLHIVGEDEIDAEAGRISHRSPIGAALLGKYVNDEVKVVTPQGFRTLAVVRVSYEAPST